MPSLAFALSSTNAKSRPASAKVMSPVARTASTCSSASNSRNETPESTSPALNHCVRNTFVEIPVGRDLSLDEWFQEREIGSCPASGLRAPPGLEQFPRMPSGEGCEMFDGCPVSVPPASWPRTMSGEGLEELLSGLVQTRSPVPPSLWPRTMSGDTLESMFQAATFAPWSDQAALLCSGLPLALPPTAPRTIPPPPVQPAPGFDSDSSEPREKLELFGLIEQEVGTADMPTIGSVGHRYGTCKPCAFLYTKGCSNGKQCEFCHLCDAGEKKRRQKEKKESLRAQRMAASQ